MGEEQDLGHLIVELRAASTESPKHDQEWERQRQAGYYSALALLASHPPAERARIRHEILERIKSQPGNARIVGNAQGALDHLLQHCSEPPEAPDVAWSEIPSSPNDQIDMLIKRLQDLKQEAAQRPHAIPDLSLLCALTQEQWDIAECR